MEIKNNKKIINLSVLLLFSAVFLFSAARFFILGSMQNAALSLLYFLILLMLPLTARLLCLSVPPLCYAMILLLCLGALLGSGYNLYLRIPHWDTLLHTLSGTLFAVLGYSICKLLFKNCNERKLPFVLFGIFFSLAVGLLWELYEGCASALFSLDMQQDCLTNEIKSFYLSGTHGRALHIKNIEKTVICYDGMKTLTLDGYLDLGLADTLSDMAVCLLGNLLFLLLLPLDRLLSGRLFPLLFPTRKEREK